MCSVLCVVYYVIDNPTYNTARDVGKIVRSRELRWVLCLLVCGEAVGAGRRVDFIWRGAPRGSSCVVGASVLNISTDRCE